MKKVITFTSKYGRAENEAIKWLQNLAECFNIKKAKFETYQHKTNYYTEDRCKLEVDYS